MPAVIEAAAAAPSSSQSLVTSCPPSPSIELIDNSTRPYRSMKLKCGVTVQVGENVMEISPGIIDDLNHDLIGCLSVLPASTRRLVRRTRIWVNHTYCYGPVIDPKHISHTTAHHFSGWLLCMRDNPEKEESIEIYNAGEYQRSRLHYNGSGLILHELCHIIHQKVLPGGLGNAMVIEIHEMSQENGKYTKVLRRDWALNDIDTDMAYCIINHKEFFAEISVAFLADFYHDVDGAGTTTMVNCSPPFVSPAVIDRIQQHALPDSKPLFTSRCRLTTRADCIILPHCSKFFPFTKGQLRRYDPRVFKCFVKIWQFIEGWEDDEGRCCCEW
eukprot:CAMPEP_0181087380 /NCGR_PEP_ID=MMETSP1071-20121207/6241_1 /TAXON_ID=35127 /ORGANISM="Thalassiosira sp., Strain NH16" /LENGTH=328 /DNA_ID=CAMNT_0023169263 /DNA_START=17 /DNA_END=1000 /DNA_ORIENTATION=+